jgi:hypothetical protein
MKLLFTDQFPKVEALNGPVSFSDVPTDLCDRVKLPFQGLVLEEDLGDYGKTLDVPAYCNEETRISFLISMPGPFFDQVGELTEIAIYQITDHGDRIFSDIRTAEGAARLQKVRNAIRDEIVDHALAVARTREKSFMDLTPIDAE